MEQFFARESLQKKIQTGFIVINIAMMRIGKRIIKAQDLRFGVKPKEWLLILLQVWEQAEPLWGAPAIFMNIILTFVVSLFSLILHFTV